MPEEKLLDTGEKRLMGLEERNRDARHIIDGASNPIAVALSIQEYSKTMLHGVGMDTIEADPALRLMVYQLAHLYKVLNIPTSEFVSLLDKIKETATE